ncbi:M56 family metallopeptidase [Phenylobacterium sp.]|uniref:M56 family metallopeptidase n=1 Tax=Phenylobacterium sp. TaxID=1871053 RepID=UPI0030F3828E
MADLIADLLRANLAASLAILLVLALRLPARRVFGAQIAYRLWLIVPLAFAASLIPAAEAPTGTPGPALPLTLTPPGAVSFATEVWVAGAVAILALMVFGQWRFLQRAKAGEAGPAVVGVIAPRIVTPADHETRFTAEERALVRAHERAHIDRGDPKTNAWVAVFQAVNWFNPLVHVAAYHLRLDQELACDATVMARRPGDRRLYAQTMLKTQLAATPLPFGCYWPAPSRHPLEARVAMLKQARPSPTRALAGFWIVMALSVAAGVGAWAAQPPSPPHVRWLDMPNQVAKRHAPATVVVISMTSEQVKALTRAAR